MATHVLLLRAPASDAGGKDPYEAQFASQNIRATSVPVYETAFTDLHEVQWIIETGAGFHGYKGVIVTSARAVEAWAKAAENVVKNSDGDHEKVDWKSTPFYVVGESTAAAVRALGASIPAHLIPTKVLGGAEAGTAEALAQFILSHLAESDSASVVSEASGATGHSARKKRGAKLLHLTGDKNRETLGKILADGGIEVDAVQVYETRGSPGFGPALKSAVASNAKAKSWWIVFFAPSGADHTLPNLREHFVLPITGSQQVVKKKGPPAARIAAIGPTTAAYLTDVLSLKVDAVAQKPGPADLAAAIKAAL